MKSKQRRRLNKLAYYRKYRRIFRREETKDIIEHIEYMQRFMWNLPYTPQQGDRTTMGLIPYIRSIQNDQDLCSS
jgi:hypothetical protein